MKTSKKDSGKRLSTGEVAAYSLGSLGAQFSGNCVNAFFLIYLCIYQGLNPLVMTVAFVLAKLWDAINDPMLAAIINNVKKSRFGRYRPWIFFGALINAGTLVAMYIPMGEGVSTVAKYTFYIAMYVLWGMSFTLVDVPFWTMLPTIANTTSERNRASSMAKLIGGLGGFLVGMIGTSIILPNFSKHGMNRAYMIIGATAGAIMIIFLLVTVIFNKEKYPIPHSNVSLKTVINLFKSNDQLRPYAFSLVLYLSGVNIATSQLLYLYTYCYQDGANLLDSSYSYTLFWIVACTGQGIAMFFYDQITKKIPREKIYEFSFWGCVFSYILMFVIFFFLKEKHYLFNAIAIALSGTFVMLSSGMNQIGSTVMIADITDYGEYKTGKRADSIMFSVSTLIQKIAGAMAMLILGIGISVAGLPTISDLPITNPDGSYNTTVSVFYDDDKYLISNEDTWELVQSDSQYDGKAEFVKENLISSRSLTIMRVFMFLMPIPLCIIAYFIYKKKYILYGKTYDDIKTEIDRRRIESGFIEEEAESTQ